MTKAPLFILASVGLSSMAQAQLVLPFAGTDPTATLSSFQIVKSGAAGRANTLYITTASNASDVLLANTIGLGKGGFFQINNTTNSNQALRGESNGTGIGVFGLMTGTGRGGVFRIINPASTNYALFVETNGSGPALKVNAGTGLAGDLVGGLRAIRTNDAISGESTAGYTGVRGKGYIGVFGVGTDTGVYGTGFYGVYASGTSYGSVSYGPTGVYGSGSDYGTYGYGGPVGAYGNGTVNGVKGVGHTAVLGLGTYMGVRGNGPSIGVQGDSPYVGVWAQGGDYGLNAVATKTVGQNYGAFCQTASAAGYALWVNGRSATTGTKSFVIDHPLDPENRLLNHFCKEAPEPMNTYSGNIVTDQHGYATVQLPEYFESINKDFRYQLTVLDGGDDFVQVKVSKRIQGNHFTLRTSKAGIEVSWQVEGVRNDRWVQQRGFKTEEPKSAAQKGKYLEPSLYGHAPDKGIHFMNMNPPAKSKAARPSPIAPPRGFSRS
jgi:hypothetical protein